VQKVAELVVLENVYQRMFRVIFLVRWLLVLHNTEESVCQVFFVFTIGNAEVKKGLELLRQLRELNKYVLLCPHLQKSWKVDAG